MIPSYEPIDVNAQHELRIELSTCTRVLHYSYQQLYDIYEEAIFYSTKSAADRHMNRQFRLSPPKDPLDAVSLDDFIALGNTLFVYNLLIK